jgi:uncharacterized protein YbjT (DUF2867 family)
MILVTGATGNNGGAIIDALIAAGHTGVRALVRDPERERVKVENFQAAGVQVVGGDLSVPESLAAAMDGVECVLVLSPVNPNMVELQANAVTAAREAGVARIVKFSMFGAARDSPVPLARWHRQAEEFVEASGLAWTHIRPNDLMGYNTNLLMPSITADGVFHDSLGDARISMVAERDVAEVAVKALTENGLEHQTLVLTGPEALSFHDVAAQLSNALGRNVRYEPVSAEHAAAAMADGGLPQDAIDLVTALRAHERTGSNAEVTTTVTDLLGRDAIRYAEFAATLTEHGRDAGP